MARAGTARNVAGTAHFSLIWSGKGSDPRPEAAGRDKLTGSRLAFGWGTIGERRGSHEPIVSAVRLG